MMFLKQSKERTERLKMKFFDSHAHYDDDAFQEDREDLLSSLQEKGVTHVVNVGADIASTKKTISLCEQYEFIYGAAGIHPEAADHISNKELDWLREQYHHPKIVAVGEIGLDYYWKEVDPTVQKEVFAAQLEFSKETKLPVIIHSRDASKDTLDMLQSFYKKSTLQGIIHCYSYSKETAREYLDMGFYFGIGGVISFANAKKLKEAVEYIPIENIVLETDCPYLAPVPYRGKRNSSLYLPEIGKELAAVKQLDFEEAMSIIYENTFRVYKIGRN